MPILDPTGEPLQPTGKAPGLLEKLIVELDKNPGNWVEMMKQFDQALDRLAPRADELHAIVARRTTIDNRNDAGKALTWALAHLAMMSMLMHRKHAQEEGTATMRLEDAKPEEARPEAAAEDPADGATS